jgi:hypothetical protein
MVKSSAPKTGWRRLKHIIFRKKKWIIATSFLIISWLIGAAVFYATEGWTYGEALYFAFITLATIGYGDLRIV